MSMDEALSALRAFQKDLERLNDTLAGSASTLGREHEHLHLLWDDAFSRRYQRRWEAFAHHLNGYLRRDAPEYQAVIQSRVAALRRYLGDD